MVDKSIAQAQIRRLASLRGWKDLNDDGKGELLAALQSSAQNEYHARGIIDRWLQTQTWLPAPSELRSTADDVPAQQPQVHRSACSICQGTGRESFWALVTIHRWPNGEIRRRQIERIPATPGRENMYLVERPALEAEVDGSNQHVAMVSGYCLCEYGQHKRTIQTPIMRNEEAA